MSPPDPAIITFGDQSITLNNLPGGRLTLAVGHSAELTCEQYVVQLRVVSREQATAEPAWTVGEPPQTVTEVRSEEGTRVVWGGPP